MKALAGSIAAGTAQLATALKERLAKLGVKVKWNADSMVYEVVKQESSASGVRSD